MHVHLQQVRAFHAKLGVAQPEYPETRALSEMDIVMRQALLFNSGQETFAAFASGDLPKILAGLVDLAYNALAAIACRGDDLLIVAVNWRQNGSLLPVVKALSDKINQCSSGETVDYSALYLLCEQLAKRFLNADFDGAFDSVHDNIMATTQTMGSTDYAQRLQQQQLPKAPDLSANLYE